MSDVISRQDAINAIKSQTIHSEEEPGEIGKAYYEGLHIAIDIIGSLPSAQKTGRWINKPNIYGVAYCTECDYELHTNDTNFCPNCGAYMKGEENETNSNR